MSNQFDSMSGQLLSYPNGDPALGSFNILSGGYQIGSVNVLYLPGAITNLALGTGNSGVTFGGTSNASNLSIGYQAASGYFNSTGLTGNSAIGAMSLRNLQSTSTYNTAVGYKAGFTISSAAANNTILGANVASTTLTTGSSNILIGTSSAVDTPAATTSNYLNIGGVITGTNLGTSTTQAVQINAGFASLRTTVADAAYTILTGNMLVAYTSLTATRAVTLPTAGLIVGQQFIIKDESGSAGTYPITFAQSIDGATGKSISTAYGELRVYWNGTAYFTW